MGMTDRERKDKRLERVKTDPEYARKYKERKRNEARARGPLNREYERQRKAKWRADNPDKNRRLRLAHWAVDNAIRSGKLVRPTSCQRCHMEGQIEAHHWSYAKEHRLDVEWLCTVCHAAADMERVSTQ